jgi:hypothetical protein
MDEVLVIRMTPIEITCGMCGVIDNHDHIDDRKAVPFCNGSPTTRDSESDGYKAVCPRCYQRWEAWEKRVYWQREKS